MSVLEAVTRKGKKVLENPRLALLELNYVARRLNRRYHSYRGWDDGYDLMAEDWDTAIILDACRYDVFAEECTLDGELSKAVSPGSNSEQFFQRTFEGDTFHDTVYVTSNPFVTVPDDETFHDVLFDETWSEEEGDAKTKALGKITDLAIDTHRRYPDKRVVVHYMAPHRPFLGDAHEYAEEGLGNFRGMAYPRETTREEFRSAYRENLRLALAEVETLVESIEGKVVVTADHGEVLGERVRPIPVRVYEHPPMNVPELVEVPWLEIENGARRDVRAEPPVGSIEMDEETRERRLRALGYVDEA